MTDLTTEALSQIPGYAEAATAKATIERWGYPADAPQDDLTGYLIDAAAKGEGMPTDLVERVARRHVMPGALNETRAILGQVKVTLQNQIDVLVGDCPDPALSHLAQRLAKLVATVKRASKTLPGTVTAEAALTAGGSILDAWHTITGAEQEYDAIRRAQHAVIGRVPGPAWVTEKRDRRPWMLRTGLLADHLDSERWWVDRRIEAAGARLSREITGEEYWAFTNHEPIPLGTTKTSTQWPNSGVALAGRTGIAAHDQSSQAVQDRQDWLLPTTLLPWPSTIEADSWWPTADHIGYLRWICEQARPWVPTHQRMIDADETALAATDTPTSRSSSLDLDRLAQAAAALAQHRKITTE